MPLVRWFLALVVATAAVAAVLVSLLLAGQGGGRERVLAGLAVVAGGLMLYAAACWVAQPDRVGRGLVGAAAWSRPSWSGAARQPVGVGGRG